MSKTKLAPERCSVISRASLPQLLAALRTWDYQVIGPVVRDGAVTYDEITAVEELPVGWSDEQSAATYRLQRRSDEACFGYTAGTQSWKRFLFPPVVRLWEARRTGQHLSLVAGEQPPPKLALLGVRSCELHALAIQDKILTGGQYRDSVYRPRRQQALIIAVQCTRAGGTCFCASTNTGPRLTFGFDLALTELIANGRHEFLVEVGSATGAKLLEQVDHGTASKPQLEQARELTEQAAAHMGRALELSGVKELLCRNLEHPRWDDVARRCLTCANCTMVCPTCFCSTVEETTDLPGKLAARWRKWDSCFTADFSYIHGGSIRATPKARYRQWLTHKFATWMDQFGTSGCVGCGRCITWCPAGIDLTEEVQAIRQTDGATRVKEH